MWPGAPTAHMSSSRLSAFFSWLLKKVVTRRRDVFLLAVSAAHLGFAQAQPAEFYAYSPPFHGNQFLLISDRVCETGARGLSEPLRSRFEVDSPPSGRAWKTSLTVTPRDGSYGSCWIEVTKQRQQALISCVQLGPRELSKDCVLLGRQAFRTIDRRR